MYEETLRGLLCIWFYKLEYVTTLHDSNHLPHTSVIPKLSRVKT